jgi:hypothetical protein
VSTADKSKCFETFISLGYGQEIEINDSNQSFLSALSVELCNSELFLLSGNQLLATEMTNNNAVLRLLTKMSIHVNCEEEMTFIASNFHKIWRTSKTDLSHLDLCVLERILSDQQLCIESEDSLFDFLAEIGLEECLSLVEYVQLEYLSTERIRLLTTAITEQKIHVSFGLLKSVCNRAALPVDASALTVKSGRYPESPIGEIVTLGLRTSSPLSGIICYLTEKYGGNVADKKIVAVSSNSVHPGSYDAKNAADLTADNYWHNKYEEDSWICYDFKNLRVRPTHYSIRSRCDEGVNGSHFRTWITETSVDGTNWTTIDEHRDYDGLNGQNVIRTFAVRTCDYCRMIRIRHQGATWKSFCVAISSFEIFGDLKE